MLNVNDMKIKKLFNCDSWKDSGGSYSMVNAVIEVDNYEKNVSFFVCSDYPEQLTIWDGWEPEFYEENILCDINYKNIKNSLVLSIRNRLLLSLN